MVALGLLMTVVFYGLGKTDFEDRVYWWTLSSVVALCSTLTIIL